MRNVIKLFIAVIIGSILGLALILEIKVLQKISEPPVCQLISVIKDVKPSYEYLKSITVFIAGCSEKSPEALTMPIDDKGMCWGGTGSIIKIDDNYTYILTNNHVAGEGQVNPILFVENENRKIQAEIIANHPYLDIAVIRVQGHLKDKTAIKGISISKIGDPVYIVGHPLLNKYTYTEGVMAGYVGISLLFQAPCIYGNSGSAIINKYGELVGVVYALQQYPGFLGLPEAQITHSIAVDSVSVKMFLKKLGLYNE